MLNMIKKLILNNSFIRGSIQKTKHLDYGRGIIAEWISECLFSSSHEGAVHILDVGCGSGEDLDNARMALKSTSVALYGVDFTRRYQDSLKEKSIIFKMINIEVDNFPFDNSFFDIVIANQVMEHTKNIFLLFNECHRVLKDNGILIVGVPNLAALHNRILLMFGEQPSCIHVLGPHVRGFTFRELSELLEREGFFKLLDWRGSHVYPFPFLIAKTIAVLFPGLSSSIFLLLKKRRAGGRFLDILEKEKFETNYFGGS